jgi:hypothetical protein
MLDCKLVCTPIVPNVKLTCDGDLDLVDATLYHHLIGSLMYVVNTKLDVCYAVNTLRQFMMEPRQSY